MAMYHLSVKPISRKKGHSIVSAAAYRSGERLYDKYYGKVYDYTRKRGIVHSEIILPSTAPPEISDRETLWNAVEESEHRHDSRLAREVEIALPNELSLREHIELVRSYVTEMFVSQGMCADACIHDKGNGNPHAHILLTTRPVDRNGFAKKKNRHWDKRGNILIWRERWEQVQNREFERKGLKIRVNHESYVKRGINREPTVHIGARVSVLERYIRTDLGDKNRAIRARNKAREKQNECEYEKSYDRER